ncbi:MAG TPA: hypothetical protein V6C57_26430 [Coleofasciculaceae cyanobacterium]
MKVKKISISSIILFSGSIAIVAATAIFNPLIIPSSVAQPATSRANTAQPDRHGLVGQVNLSTPVQVKFMNQTPVILAIETPGSETYNINPGDNISSTIPQIPAYFFIQAAQQDMSLNYDVTVQDNQVIVQIQPVSGNTAGDGALKITRIGYIYVY